MNVLAVVSHPDDEILGVGGTLLKHKELGDSVYVCITTKAFEPLWTKEYMRGKIKEQKQVDKLLGVKKRYHLDYPTTKLNTIAGGEFNAGVTKVVDEVNPNIIYTHFENDLNYDHTVTMRACLVASRPPRKIKLLCFETLSETEWGHKPFLPNYWVDIGKHIDRKIEIFELYESEVKKYPHPRSREGIKDLARKRGVEMCIPYAESFILIKEMWT